MSRSERSKELKSRTYQSYTNAELDHWVKLKNTTNSSGRKPTWDEVALRTGIKAGTMIAVVSQRKRGLRKNTAEKRAARAAQAEDLAERGVPLFQMAEKISLSPPRLANFLNSIGIMPKDRARLRRIAGFRQQALEIVRERRGL